MELLFSTLIGAGIGAILRYALPGRIAYGSALLPAVGGAVTAAVWVALLWAGLTFDGGWIWFISLLAGGAVCLVLALVLPRVRKEHDSELFEKLAKAPAAV
jgi:hypothetical protein